MNFYKLARFSVLAAMVLLPVMVLAQLPTATVPTVPGLTLSEIEDIIKRIARFFLVIGVILAIVYIIWGAITWMASGGDEKKIQKGKDRVKNAVWAALVIIAVGLILQTLAGIVARTFFG